MAARYRVARQADKLKAFAEFPAPAQAIEYLTRKDLVPWSVVRENFSEYRNRAFWLARVEEVRILATVRDELARALEQGITQEAFTQAVQDAVGGDFTRARLETVYRTNLQSAYEAGNYEMLHDPAVADLFPYYQYVTAGDDRVRPEHAAMDGKVFARDDKIWATWWPPNGYNCRCTVVGLDADAVAELGIKGSDRWPEVSPGAGKVMPDNTSFWGPPTSFDWKTAAQQAESQAKTEARSTRQTEKAKIEKGLAHDPITSSERLGAEQSGINVSKKVKDSVDGIFKPASGEAGTGPARQKAGIKPGSYYKREVAAYRVDAELGWDQVPVTVERTVDRAKGSLQEFVQDAREVSDDLALKLMMGEGRLDNQERMTAFDLLIGQTDRHFDNVLVRSTATEMRAVAIDNGLAFPAKASEAIIRIDYATGNNLREVSEDIRQAMRDLLSREAEVRAQLKGFLSSAEIDGMFARARRLSELQEWPTRVMDWNGLIQQLGFKGLHGWV